MNLEQFLVYIHNGAYDVAQELICIGLDVKDRKNLRLVSRATNEVVLSFPILKTIHISTHQTDLDYLQVVSKNQRLLQRVKVISWDHSVHDFFCLQFAPPCHRPQTRATLKVTEWMREKLVQQRLNLTTERDLSLVMKILPFLINVDTIEFDTCFWRRLQWVDYPVGFSPAQIQYINWRRHQDTAHIMDNALFRGFKKVDDLYFPADTVEKHPEVLLTELPAMKIDLFNWRFLPIRGVKILQHLSNTDDGCPGGLKHLFFKLKTLTVRHITHMFLKDNLLEFLKNSAVDIKRLDVLADERGLDNVRTRIAFTQHIKPLFEKGFLTLQHLVLFIDICSYNQWIRDVYVLLPRFNQLISLTLGGMKTYEKDLLALGHAVFHKPTITHIELQHVWLLDSKWSTVLGRWKDCMYLNHMSRIELDFVRQISEVYRHMIIEYRTAPDRNGKSAIVEWLNGRGEFPLFSDYI